MKHLNAFIMTALAEFQLVIYALVVIFHVSCTYILSLILKGHVWRGAIIIIMKSVNLRLSIKWLLLSCYFFISHYFCILAL